MKNPLIYKDFYKVGHINQYPEGTTKVYSNFTARKSRTGFNYILFFGLQMFIKKILINSFNKNFFSRPKEEAVSEYKILIDSTLGPNAIETTHLEALHNLGYLPIQIKALEEGTLVPIGVPCLTITNTKPEFYWLTNMLETMLSAELWGPCTSATTAFRYRSIFERAANLTGYDKSFIGWQGHDFSMRGMFGIKAAISSGIGHLTSFYGTDTIPAIPAVKHYYNTDYTKELVGGSVPATEHSVMCMGGNETELETFRRLITKVYPKGIVSIVSDTWNYWDVLEKHIPALKEEILARDGKVVIRPDSGNPADIICGLPKVEEFSDANWNKYSRFIKDDKVYEINLDRVNDFYNEFGEHTDGPYWKDYVKEIEVTEAEKLGTIEYLWNLFGGTKTKEGYRVLDSHIGLIYGDSITPKLAEEICNRLISKGFAPTIVLGIGSYTYQHVTRDTYGFAMKATYGEINGKPVSIYKDPITDNGTKKSAKGLLAVFKNEFNGDYELHQEVTPEVEAKGELKTVFLDGKLTKDYDFTTIRENVNKQIRESVPDSSLIG